MAWTMLRFVNQTLKELGLVGGEQEELLSFSDSARQRPIDVIIQKTNETVHEIYTSSTTPIPTETRERDIVLVAGRRDYVLPESLAQIRYPLINSADSMRIDEYEGGYLKMRADQLQPDQWVGTPYRACIHTGSGRLYMERFPQDQDAGRIYTMIYDRDLALEDEGDIFPFRDMAARALVAAVVERYKQSQRGGMDEGVYWASVSRATEYAGMKIRKSIW